MATKVASDRVCSVGVPNSGFSKDPEPAAAKVAGSEWP